MSAFRSEMETTVLATVDSNVTRFESYILAKINELMSKEVSQLERRSDEKINLVEQQLTSAEEALSRQLAAKSSAAAAACKQVSDNAEAHMSTLQEALAGVSAQAVQIATQMSFIADKFNDQVLDVRREATKALADRSVALDSKFSAACAVLEKQLISMKESDPSR